MYPGQQKRKINGVYIHPSFSAQQVQLQNRAMCVSHDTS